MTYHTGRAGADSGTAVQYRNIETPWGNIKEWRDGIIFSDVNICTYNKPANFSDTYNGTGAIVRSNKRVSTSGWIKVWGQDTNDLSFIYPSELSTSETTFVPDYQRGGISTKALSVGGSYQEGVEAGPFYLDCNYRATDASANRGSRLMKLPNPS